MEEAAKAAQTAKEAEAAAALAAELGMPSVATAAAEQTKEAVTKS